MKVRFPAAIAGLVPAPVKVTAVDESLVGTYDDTTGLIEISPSQTEAAAYLTLAHELVHYAMHRSGVSGALFNLVGDKEDVARAFEEFIVLAIENYLLKTEILVFNKKSVTDWKTVKFKDEDKD